MCTIARSGLWDRYLGVGMLLEPDNPNPRKGVHRVGAGVKVRPEYPLPSPGIEDRHEFVAGKPVVSLRGRI